MSDFESAFLRLVTDGETADLQMPPSSPDAAQQLAAIETIFDENTRLAAAYWDKEDVGLVLGMVSLKYMQRLKPDMLEVERVRFGEWEAHLQGLTDEQIADERGALSSEVRTRRLTVEGVLQGVVRQFGRDQLIREVFRRKTDRELANISDETIDVPVPESPKAAAAPVQTVRPKSAAPPSPVPPTESLHVENLMDLMEPAYSDWRHKAECRKYDPERFFPSKQAKRQIGEAKEICTSCAVRTICLEEALQNGTDFGVWGGLSEDERRDLKQRKRR